MGMVKRYQQEMDDMGDVMVNTTKKEKNMKTQKMAPIAEVSGVDVKSMLRKMGALKEEEPVAPQDIDWNNYAELLRIFENTIGCF